MGYLSKLGLDKPNGEVFDAEIDEYFLSKGFYYDTMNPRFMNGHGYNKLTTDKKCLRYDHHDDEGYTIRVFMNALEAYTETQTPWRSYETSSYVRFDEEPTSVQELEAHLDDLMD